MEVSMKNRVRFAAILLCALATSIPALAQTTNVHNPTWWAKYQHLLKKSPSSSAPSGASLQVGSNVDVSNECGPQSETFIALDPLHLSTLAAGSNEIFRLPMRGYFSSNGGVSWGGVDLPLPPAIGTNGVDFGSDPSLAFDTLGNTFYSYIVVFFGAGAGNSIKGTEMAVAKSGNGGKTYPFVNFFSFSSGEDHFNDKPMITTDNNAGSAFHNNIYVAWDAASGGSSGGGIRVATSRDHGASFAVVRADDPSGPGVSIGAVPFVGPDGVVYTAWNDVAANTIGFARSSDGGTTWERPNIVSTKTATFDVGIPAESFRRALVYPACDADRSNGPHRGRLYCSWMDLTPAGTTDIFLSFSDDQGTSWSKARTVADPLPVDRFSHWLSVDPATGDVNLSFYDTRNDTTGFRYQTDVYFTRSSDGGSTFLSPNVRVTDVSSNEHDCNGVFPCSGIDYGNQQGDYEGLVASGGVAHPIWTDSRRQLEPSSGCAVPLLMEEVFTATVK
jgi:hypothetical protein